MIYKDYSLSKPQLKILKELKEHPLSDLNQFQKSDINFLTKIEFISLNKEKSFFKNPDKAPFFYLHDTGRMFLLNALDTKPDFRFWLPFCLSAIALIKSFLPELSLLAEKILKLWIK